MSILPQRDSTKAIGPNGESAEFVFVTPELARKYLACNIANNRSIKSQRVAAYQRDISAGRFVLTGETIIFDIEGRMINGQNRCRAIVNAQTPAWILVVSGVSYDALVVLDSGLSRTSADMLTIAGIAPRPEAKDMAAIIRFYRAWKIGDIRSAGSIPGGSTSMTRSELADAALEIQGLEFAARYSKALYKYLQVPVGAIGVAFLEFSDISVDATAQFFDRIRDGVQTGPSDPFTTLSRRITTDRRLGSGHRMLPATALFYLFRTWNAWRANEPLTKFQIGSADNGWASIPRPK